MCTLAVYHRVSAAVPLLVAANRDEFLARPASEPRLLSSDPWVVAGQDQSAGGTWLGLNESGLVVGVLNKRSPPGVDPSRRSRGLLCLEALQETSLERVRTLLRGERAGRYNGFNLLAANAEGCLVATTHGDCLEVRDLAPGVHLLTNLEVDDPTCPRIAKSHRRFAAVSLPQPEGLDGLLPELGGILADHSTPLDPRSEASENLCVHRGPYGTRSSTIIALPAAAPARYWHAAGPPCSTPYSAVALPG